MWLRFQISSVQLIATQFAYMMKQMCIFYAFSTDLQHRCYEMLHDSQTLVFFSLGHSVVMFHSGVAAEASATPGKIQFTGPVMCLS